MPTDKQRLEKLARRMAWNRRHCDGTKTAYGTDMPFELYGFKHPESDTLHPDDLRAWIDAQPEPNHNFKPKE